MWKAQERACVCVRGGGGARGGEHINLKGMSESEVGKAQERVGSGG